MVAHGCKTAKSFLLRCAGLLIFLGKKQNFAGFSGGNLRKNWLIRGIFAGKKSKFAEKSADFQDFPGKKVKIRGEIG